MTEDEFNRVVSEVYDKRDPYMTRSKKDFVIQLEGGQGEPKAIYKYCTKEVFEKCMKLK